MSFVVGLINLYPCLDIQMATWLWYLVKLVLDFAPEKMLVRCVERQLSPKVLKKHAREPEFCPQYPQKDWVWWYMLVILEPETQTGLQASLSSHQLLVYLSNSRPVRHPVSKNKVNAS